VASFSMTTSQHRRSSIRGALNYFAREMHARNPTLVLKSPKCSVLEECWNRGSIARGKSQMKGCPLHSPIIRQERLVFRNAPLKRFHTVFSVIVRKITRN
jgi:hypothetical protein